jgi:hypothetical protein
MTLPASLSLTSYSKPGCVSQLLLFKISLNHSGQISTSKWLRATPSRILLFSNLLALRNIPDGNKTLFCSSSNCLNYSRQPRFPGFFMCDEFQEIISANREGISDMNFWDKSRSSKNYWHYLFTIHSQLLRSSRQP